VNFGKLEEKDASQGTEINGKTRPAVVISNNLQNEKGRRVVILPMSTTIIDKRRLQNYAGKLSDQQIAEAEAKLRRVLALEDIKRIIFTIFNK
jgi:mRNA-degrading endonuclease toxin of MazEF toxin-antitoxin module